MATTANTRIKDKIRALLAQAEDPAVTEQEAQAFAAKAAELMARHALDEAVVRADKGQKPETIKRLDYTVSGQGWHGKARASLVHAVAQANGCEVCTIGNVLNGQDRTVTIIGTASALDALSLLLPSIVLQAETYGAKATKAHMATVRDTIDTAANRNIERRTFLRSYLKGYGHGVAQKINASRTQMAQEVADKPGALVLVTDADRAKRHFTKLFPKLGKDRNDSISTAGFVTGTRDGRTADTGDTKVNGRARRAVTKRKTAQTAK